MPVLDWYLPVISEARYGAHTGEFEIACAEVAALRPAGRCWACGRIRRPHNRNGDTELVGKDVEEVGLGSGRRRVTALPTTRPMILRRPKTSCEMLAYLE